ncbi:MAG: beta-N-acetylhexosaminidase [Bacteroidales bacterium]
MKKIWKIVAWILLILVAAVLILWYGFLKPAPPPISDQDRSQITVMPLPADLKLRKGKLDLTGPMEEEFTGISTPRLQHAVQRLNKMLSSRTGPGQRGESAVRLILNCEQPSGEIPEAGIDESYTLRISDKGILLKAPSEWGILHGLETLQQLIRQEDGTWNFPVLILHDRPRYPWRGLMIDACRHWIPKEVILRNLDGMAAVKLNVLHWHLSDYQAFRVESSRFPKLQEMGSGGYYYSQDDIREVIAYAAERGIRVVPEFDLPGHSTSWFAGYPWLASAPGPYVPDTVFGVLEPLMDPTREEVYQFLGGFFEEMAELFPDDYIHIGGDEVATRQWDSNPDILLFMEENNLEDADALQTYFNGRLYEILSSNEKFMMGWDEIINPDLPVEGIVVQSWTNQSSLWESARQGYGAVLSSGYYLDYKQPAGFHYRVDPAVIPGAVNIEIDSTHWRSWDCSLSMNDTDIDGIIYLFGEADQLRGIMSFMEMSMGFNQASLRNNHLSFALDSDYGTIQVETTIEGDSIFGSVGLSFFKLDLTGHRSGGSDLAEGNPLPEFKQIEPLTESQEANILGGEACMWSEMVDGWTLESRIWPRAAAVAEKLWSPASLTGNEKDMYRRLMVINDRLEERGMQHRAYRDQLLRSYVTDPYIEPLRTLVGLLQEDRLFNRMVIYHPELYTTTPLNRMVDAAPPESYRAYRFSQQVDRWLESGDEEVANSLKTTLESWIVLHDQLAPVFEASETVAEVEPHAAHLSEIARWGLTAVEGDHATLNDPAIQSLFNKAKEACGGTLLAVVDPVQKLVEAASLK